MKEIAEPTVDGRRDSQMKEIAGPTVDGRRESQIGKGFWVATLRSLFLFEHELPLIDH